MDIYADLADLYYLSTQLGVHKTSVRPENYDTTLWLNHIAEHGDPPAIYEHKKDTVEINNFRECIWMAYKSEELKSKNPPKFKKQESENVKEDIIKKISSLKLKCTKAGNMFVFCKLIEAEVWLGKWEQYFSIAT